MTRQPARSPVALAVVVGIAALLTALVVQGAGQAGGAGAKPPATVRLYVFDCGALEGLDVGRFGLKPNEVVTSRMSVACYLVAHPKGTLAWDVGAVPDAAWTPTGKPVAYKIVLGNRQERTVTVTRRLDAQMKEAGFPPFAVTHLALSHNHWDHTANANQFAAATWLVPQAEYDVMFPATPSADALTMPSTFSALRTSKRVLVKGDEHDVFGDGSVVIRAAPGHTPAHQVLYVKLRKTGGVVLSGDLYHYPEERTLSRLPVFEVDAEKTRQARAALEGFLKKAGATLWIQHDFTADAKLKKAPAYYE
jgi:glyoxylase-like metal-dependent hydrolase (beta-lactamase superfamily II)